MSELNDLYQEVIMAHNNDPYHYQKQENADYELDAYNQFCGDHFQIYLIMEGELIKEAWFHGYGCAISKASTSILVKELEGKTLAEIEKLYQSFHEALNSEEDSAKAFQKEFLAFQPVQKFPGRKKCATLSWDELEGIWRGR